MSECIICLDNNDTLVTYPTSLSTCECKYSVHIMCENKLLDKDKNKCIICKEPFQKSKDIIIDEAVNDIIIDTAVNDTGSKCKWSKCLGIFTICLILLLFVVITYVILR